MNKICYLCLVLTFITLKSNAQKNKTILFGKVLNTNKSIQDVHIINLKSRFGTISNSNGEFEIVIRENDSLLISSLEYKSVIIGINKSHIKTKKILIHLEPVVNKLDEVFLHGLTGSLNVDLNKTTKDTIPKHSFKYNISDLDKKLPPDTHGFLEAPNSLKMTDPTYIEGGGASASASIPDYYLIALRKLKRELKNKKVFPSKIKQELGVNYFINNLKISEEKIDHFLAYCEYKNIIEEYYKNNLLEVIKILQEESKTYHEIKD